MLPEEAARIRRRKLRHHRAEHSQEALHREAPNLARPDCQAADPSHHRAARPEACHREAVPNHHRAANQAAFRQEARREADPNHHPAASRAAFLREVHQEAVPSRRHRRAAYPQEAFPQEARREAAPSHHLHQEAIPEAFLQEVHQEAVPNRRRPPEVRIRHPACTGSYHSRRHLDLVGPKDSESAR